MKTIALPDQVPHMSELLTVVALQELYRLTNVMVLVDRVVELLFQDSGFVVTGVVGALEVVVSSEQVLMDWMLVEKAGRVVVGVLQGGHAIGNGRRRRR